VSSKSKNMVVKVMSVLYNKVMTIRLLPPEIASQIAAGEVVERPASVVKELVENALDAGASSIQIKVEGAGQRLVEISDDGSGIPAAELELAVARHATSKLVVAEDLFKIQTLGFRGEALASIGSVSQMTITSRPAEQEVAMRLHVEGGLLLTRQPVGAPVGTQVRVEDLFYNVPARRKFMKSEVTERRQIDALVTRYALAYPQVRFQLTQENRNALNTTGSGNRREVLAALYGVEDARQLIEVIAKEDELAVTGFISPVHLTRSNRRDITFFINGRPVQDAALTAAVMQAYHTLLMVGRYPMGTLFIEIPAEQVDVNVHPTKAEVRFRDAGRVFSGLQRAVRRALLAHTPVPGLGPVQVRWSPESDQTSLSHGVEPDWQPTAQRDHPFTALVDASSTSNGSSAQAPQMPAVQPILRLVGQIAASYLAAEGPDGLYLIDQHAAHERVLFERMSAEYQKSDASHPVPSQRLLQPEVVMLPPASARLVADQLAVLERCGFQVDLFGPNTFRVHSLPILLAGMPPASALKVLVEDFEEDETPLQAQMEQRLIARICKRAAVKAGHVLSKEEQQALLNDLVGCASPRTCPHGRPTMIHISVDLLERQFGRRGAR
jgi:DNA mismatch repair protein MutL